MMREKPTFRALSRQTFKLRRCQRKTALDMREKLAKSI